jgi:AcrR family transcriptional regulator
VPYLPAEERRRSIVDAAIAVIAAEGLAGATTRRIAERAKAPLGALHYCFRDKEELIELVADRGAGMLTSCFDEVDPARGLEQTIRDSVAAMWRWVRENGGLQLALMELGMWRIRKGGPPEEVYAMWDRFGGDLLRENLGEAVRLAKAKPALTVEEMTRFINHRFDGLAFEYAASGDDAACERQTLLLAEALVLLVTNPVRKARRTAVRTSR